MQKAWDNVSCKAAGSSFPRKSAHRIPAPLRWRFPSDPGLRVGRGGQHLLHYAPHNRRQRDPARLPLDTHPLRRQNLVLIQFH